MIKEKMKWTCLLLVAILLFITSLVTGNSVFSIVAMCLAVLIYKNGDEILFSDINRRKKDKKKKAEILKKASRIIITEGRLKKNKGGE